MAIVVIIERNVDTNYDQLYEMMRFLEFRQNRLLIANTADSVLTIQLPPTPNSSSNQTTLPRCTLMVCSLLTRSNGEWVVDSVAEVWLRKLLKNVIRGISGRLIFKQQQKKNTQE